ncbi:hypothetical protein [Caulobacter sp. RL271]|uniref:Uncharacterized protein n=1 Tax=Caulobacter segnis TaxID=88688 RepID=A0ABY4ZRQ8_9CAUL|nr:hypothetical protein [Caulobacter segnis]USQ95276.1 hypothetical protein MZV50_22440 [Caulobacter segnis]
MDFTIKLGRDLAHGLIMALLPTAPLVGVSRRAPAHDHAAAVAASMGSGDKAEKLRTLIADFREYA